jgi:hypothetical protein
MESNIPQQATITALNPRYGLPRFSAERKVKYITVNRKQSIADAETGDYVVLNMSLPGRANNAPKIYEALYEQGFCRAASFKSEVPFFANNVLHSVNPIIVIFQRPSPAAACGGVPRFEINRVRQHAERKLPGE